MPGLETGAVAALLASALLAPAGPARAQATLREINLVRAAHGLVALRADPRLGRAARAHSRDMVARGYFAHRSPSGAGLVVRVTQTGWLRGRRRWRLAENLAWGTGPLACPQAVVAAWMHSPAHRRHLLDPRLQVAGIGVARGTPFTPAGATYTAELGCGC
jgi:uncharacterized protein YkwD